MNKTCARCEKTVYPTEELKCLDKTWHKGCFKCQECGMTLNMRTYKGYGKLPYCEAHVPKAKPTTMAETPELKRIAENTKLQSNVKYHADFEKSKGKFTQVADDPETLRIKANTKIISNVAYHGELEKKAHMERQRQINENGELVDVLAPDSYHQQIDNYATEMLPPSVSVPNLPPKNHYQIPTTQYQPVIAQQTITGHNQPMTAHNQPIGHNHPMTGHSQQIAAHNQQPMGHSQQSMGHNQQSMGHNHQSMGHNQQPVGHNQQSMGHNQQPVGHNQQSMGHNQQPVGHNQQSMGHNQQLMGHNQQPMGHNQTNQNRYTDQYYKPQEDYSYQYQDYPGQYYGQYPQNYGVSGQPKIGRIQDYDPINDGPRVPPNTQRASATLIYNSTNDGKQRGAHQPVQQQQSRQIGRVTDLDPLANEIPRAVPNQRVYVAMYDYEANDSDEVSFREGDIISNVSSIDEGWMTGQVVRTGRTGMLPANYVELAPAAPPGPAPAPAHYN